MKSYLILFAIFACTMSGCNQINTKIGWPSVYWEQGFVTVVELLVVCFLFFLSLLGVISGEEHPGYLITGIVIWLVAVFLLQSLPHAEKGIQIVPVPPWYYASQIAWIISTASWSILILGCLVNLSIMKTGRHCAAVAVLLAGVLNALLSFASPSYVASKNRTEIVASIEPCENKTEQWEKNKQQQSEVLQKLLHEKEMLENRIKNLGIRTKTGTDGSSIAGPLVEELEQLIQQIAKVQNKIAAIESVLSKLRSLEREKSLHKTGLSAEELTNISQKLKVELLNRTDDPLPDSAVQRDILLNGLITRPEGGN